MVNKIKRVRRVFKKPTREMEFYEYWERLGDSHDKMGEDVAMFL